MLREHVRLKVHRLARYRSAEVCVGKGVRCDPENRGLAFQISDGQRDPVDGDRAFADAEPVNFSRKRNFYYVILPGFPE